MIIIIIEKKITWLIFLGCNNERFHAGHAVDNGKYKQIHLLSSFRFLSHCDSDFANAFEMLLAKNI